MPSRVLLTLALAGLAVRDRMRRAPTNPQIRAAPMAGATGQSSPSKSTLDVNNLFAGVCGFCHNDGGRKAGRGPQLMNTTRSDDFIRYRIKHGKEGAMPAFPQFSDADIDAIIAYIHNLKPEQS